MGDLYDSVYPFDIPDLAPAVLGYDDGRTSKWSAAGWAEWVHVPQLHMSVTANPNSLAFDVEGGNAPAAQAVEAVRLRFKLGRPSVIYLAEASLAEVTRLLEVTGLTWTDASAWPQPEAYLMCANPTGVAHLRPSWAPVLPVACQWYWSGLYDRSETYGAFPALTTAPPTPVPPVAVQPPSEDEDMFVLLDPGRPVPFPSLGALAQLRLAYDDAGVPGASAEGAMVRLALGNTTKGFRVGTPGKEGLGGDAWAYWVPNGSTLTFGLAEDDMAVVTNLAPLGIVSASVIRTGS